MTEKLSTGIDELDRKLDGGIPAGQVIVLSASPVSQSELFLYEMAAIRSTTYLTTERPTTEVRDSLSQTNASSGDITIHRIGTVDPLAEAEALVQEVGDNSTLIIDPTQLLEETETVDYLSFMNSIKSHTVDTGSVTVLHCLDGRQVPQQRDRTEYLADIIFSISTNTNGASVQNKLTVPKFRGGQALPEAINLDLTADVTIDVTRKIA